MSDPVTGTKYTPVGVDFFEIMDRGEPIGDRSDQFGPFGDLKPVQKYNQTGRGHYRCTGGQGESLSNANNSASGERMLRKGGKLLNLFESV